MKNISTYTMFLKLLRLESQKVASYEITASGRANNTGKINQNNSCAVSGAAQRRTVK